MSWERHYESGLELNQQAFNTLKDHNTESKTAAGKTRATDKSQICTDFIGVSTKRCHFLYSPAKVKLLILNNMPGR